jgi:hypothetical protein
MKWFLLIILLVVCIYFYYYRQKRPNKIICPPGSIGDYCQYNNSDFCFDRGDVLLNKNNEPFCKCFGNFGGKNCETCKDGYAGKSCEFSSKEFCKDRGTISANRDNRPYCLTCEHPFDGINCQKCKPGYAGINCDYTDSYCSDSTGTIRGKVYADSSGNPKCNCFSSFFGNKCQYTTSSNCNYRGRYDSESDTCMCMDEYYGDKCQYIHKEECGENGIITYIDYDSTPPRITCTCNTYKGYYGSKCQFNEKQQCRGRGRLRIEYITKRGVDNKEVIEEKAVCDCSGNFTGNNCIECKDGFYTPEYDCKYSNASCNTTNFNIPGSTVTLPPNRLIYDNITKKLSCACYKGDERSVNKEGKQSGSRCQFLDSALCNNRGYVERIIDEKSNPPKVKCKCEDPLIFTGDKCECKEGLKGNRCQYSDQKTCNNRGVVDNNGNCTCLDGYTGVNCSECNDDYLGFYTPDNKFFCVAKDFCVKKGLVGKTPSQIYTDGSVRCS